MTVLIMAASHSSKSVNKALSKQIEKIVSSIGRDVDVVDYTKYVLPPFNPDLKESQGYPENLIDFVRRLEHAESLIFSVPEYNFSVAGHFKNFIDWVSTMRPIPWKGKKILLSSASPSLCGGVRGLWAARIPLEGCRAFVYPEMFSLSSATTAFAEDGSLADPKQLETLTRIITEFLHTHLHY